MPNFSAKWGLMEQLQAVAAGTWTGIPTDELYAWGYNTEGQLGLNDTANRSSPVQVGALVNWAQVSAGATFTACVTTAGTLFTWGVNTDGQIGDGTVIARSSPVQVGALTNWAQVSAGLKGTTACVTTAGTLFTWGFNGFGQLGQNNIIYRSSPVQVGALTNWAQVSVGFHHTACVTTAGTLFTWGRNNFGQLGLGVSTNINRSSPVQVGALTNWAQVATGAFNTACVTTAGTLFTWGIGTFGQLGDGTAANKSSPVQVGSLTNWAQVSAGLNGTTVCVTTAGTLFAWGRNAEGQLGQGNTIWRSSPVQVGALTNWAQVSAGNQHTACVTTAGTLFAWGDNASGQLGDGTAVNRSSPVQVGALTSWTQVSSGSSTVAIYQGVTN